MIINRQSMFSVPLLILILIVISSNVFAAKKLFKPLVLAEESSLSLDQAKEKISKKIADSPFKMVAEFEPYADAYIYVITNDDLIREAGKSKFGAFAAPQRISLTTVKDQIQIAYTNPVFMQHAYQMKKSNMVPFLEQMKDSFGFIKEFGGEGLSERKLKRYKYSFGLESFSDFYELPDFKTHKEAIAAVEKGLKDKSNGISKVYSIKISKQKTVVYGVKMDPIASGDSNLDERKTMNVIDYKALKRTPYLPYEMVVKGDKIYVMHARYRIAVYFNDLPMYGANGFGKLFNTPGAYYQAFTKVAGGTVEEQNMMFDEVD